MNILFLMADGFEETEFVTPFDYLQRAGIDVYMASISDSISVQGGHGLVIEADGLLSELDVSIFDGFSFRAAASPSIRTPTTGGPARNTRNGRTTA